MELSKSRIVDWWNGEVVELSNRRMVEWWGLKLCSCGIVESSNGEVM